MSSLSLKLLPFSKGKYIVDESSEIRDNDGRVIESLEIDGKCFVSLDWYEGLRYYEKGLVVLAAFDKIGFGTELYNRVEVVYRDGDVTNSFLSNLTYLFSGDPIESVVPGYFLIPEIAGYAISRSGQVVNLSTRGFKAWSTQHGKSLGTRTPGYQYMSVGSRGSTRTIYEHRTLCLVFLKPKGVFNSLTVNHKDGDKTNNDLANLEWVTYSENLKHAWQNDLRFQSRNSVLVRNLLNEEIRSFRSLREASRFLGGNSAFHITERLKDQSGKLWPDYLLFKMNDGTDWPVIDRTTLPRVAADQAWAVVARNVFTGDMVILNQASDSKEFLGIESDVVIDHARTHQVIPYKGYNFRYLASATSWPQHSGRHLEVYRDYQVNPPSGVIVFDHQSQTELFYTSTHKCSEALGISVNSLQNHLFHEKRRFEDRYTFKLFKLREHIA